MIWNWEFGTGNWEFARSWPNHGGFSPDISTGRRNLFRERFGPDIPNGGGNNLSGMI